jgi:decaprenyl-phosphate phosphoribosyltransferase
MDASTTPTDQLPGPALLGHGALPDHALWTSVRPRQWIKNLLVAAATAAAGTLLAWTSILPLVVSFVAMCAASSSTYLINDLSDRSRDRCHPTKCRRPIASGALSVRRAKVASAAFIGVALTLSLLLGAGVAAVMAAYLVLTITYSRWLKHVPYLELALVASGFVLRVAIGSAATHTALSVPFLVVIGAGSLFLATGKRLSELISLGRRAGEHRPVLAHYRTPVLERLVGASLITMLGAYTLWAVGTDTGDPGLPWLVLSVAPVAVAALHLTRRVLRGDAGDPTGLVIEDRVLRVAGGVAALLVSIGLYVL